MGLDFIFDGCLELWDWISQKKKKWLGVFA
jgi:hypothetical protein